MNYSRGDLKRYIEWDLRNWSHALYFWDKYSTKNFSECIALEIGARNGGLSLWLANKGCRVICSDLHGPTEIAKDLHKKFQSSKNIEYQNIDANSIPYKDHFDIIIFKSVLGGIGRDDHPERQQNMIKEIYNALKPGGELFFAENLIASPLHQFFRKKYVAWASDWRYVSMNEMLNWLEIFRSTQTTTNGYAGAFGRTEWQRNLFGILDSILLNYILPSNWKYISIGIASK